MRKLIETVRESIIVCDNPKCNYKIPYSEHMEKNIKIFIDVPCPKCGENLLTNEDYLLDQKLMRSVRWINKWFSWVTLFYSKESWSKRGHLHVHVHNGINIENNK